MSNWCTFVTCDGEAHANPFIDNCMVCLRHGWGALAACPKCLDTHLQSLNDKTTDIEKPVQYVLLPSKTKRTGQCVTCFTRYSIPRVHPETSDFQLFVRLRPHPKDPPALVVRIVKAVGQRDARLRAWRERGVEKVPE